MPLPSIYSPKSPTCSTSFSPSSLTFREKFLSWNSEPRVLSSSPDCPVPNKSCILPQQTSCHSPNTPPYVFTSLSLLEYPFSKTVRLLFSHQDPITSFQPPLLTSPRRAHPFLFCIPSTICSWQHIAICSPHSICVLLSRAWCFLRVGIGSYFIYLPLWHYLAQCVADCGHTIIVLGINALGALGP